MFFGRPVYFLFNEDRVCWKLTKIPSYKYKDSECINKNLLRQWILLSAKILVKKYMYNEVPLVICECVYSKGNYLLHLNRDPQRPPLNTTSSIYINTIHKHHLWFSLCECRLTHTHKHTVPGGCMLLVRPLSSHTQVHHNA